MKNALLISFIVIAGFVLQTSAIPAILHVFSDATDTEWFRGATVDFGLLAVFYLSMRRDLYSAALWAFFIQLFLQAFSPAWPGTAAVSYLSVVLACSVLKHNILLKDALSLALFAAAITGLAALVQVFTAGLFYRIPDPFSSQGRFIIISMFIHSLAAPAVFRVLRTVDVLTRHPSLERRSQLLPEI